MDHGRRRAARVRGKVDYAKLHGAELQSDGMHLQASWLQAVLIDVGIL